MEKRVMFFIIPLLLFIRILDAVAVALFIAFQNCLKTTLNN